MSALRSRSVEVLKWFSIGLFVVLVCVVVWQVFARQVLSAPSAWSTTVSQYLLIWLVLFSVAMVFGERGHVAVDFFARMLPRAGQRITNVLVALSILAFSALGLVWGGLRGMSISWHQTIPGLPVTVGQMYLALPIAGVIIAVFALDDLVRAARGEDMLAGDDAQQAATISAAGTGEADGTATGGSTAGGTSADDPSPDEPRSDNASTDDSSTDDSSTDGKGA
ncbi:TRAP transporter small permease [Brachybacterium fresconis]|uniref:TRAP-type C4-dicarboxylate transport system permease small subunit n=1 Tax=Brachybacterium fresconis TaxID=173363 RepID=A0ABS4YQ65_9MICO|nr:TRAP transporter small permease [Brachybacterium fresconis]MBP2410532.1 TRAP-type C4-dicarboxylate transport system permease small subunit [Brachybacterium fresconis]